MHQPGGTACLLNRHLCAASSFDVAGRHWTAFSHCFLSPCQPIYVLPMPRAHCQALAHALRARPSSAPLNTAPDDRTCERRRQAPAWRALAPLRRRWCPCEHRRLPPRRPSPQRLACWRRWRPRARRRRRRRPRHGGRRAPRQNRRRWRQGRRRALRTAQRPRPAARHRPASLQRLWHHTAYDKRRQVKY